MTDAVEHPVLEMRGIRKSFGGIEVLHGVDFEVGAGEIHALIGHNGAGKSTLIKVLGGVFPDFDGDVKVNGTDARATTPKDAIENGVAIIYQDFALIPDLDVAHNIALGREPSRAGMLLPHADVYRRSQAEAEKFGISLPMREPVRRLGVAQQQLIEIVRALARDAKVLVMDEPTARLAPPEREQLFQVMRSLAERGVGIVYISHFLDEVLDVSDTVTIMRDGEVVAREAASSFTTSDLARALVGEEGARESEDATRAPIGDVLLDIRGLSVHDRAPSDIVVRAGEIVALAGLVGSGRTSLARGIVGDLRSRGSVRLAGRPVPRNPVGAAKAGLVLIPEDRKRTGLVLTSSVTENIELTGLGRGLTRVGLVRRGAVKKAVARTIERLGVRPADPNKIVGALSGGNAQKVLIGRAIAGGVRAMIFDQPTAGVDIGAKADLHREVRALAREGSAVIVISDDIDETLDLADRLLIVVAGRVVADHRADEMDRVSLLRAISTSTEAAA